MLKQYYDDLFCRAVLEHVVNNQPALMSEWKWWNESDLESISGSRIALEEMAMDDLLERRHVGQPPVCQVRATDRTVGYLVRRGLD